MTALSITAANVRPSTDAQTQQVTAGETITAGQPVYLKSADGEYYKADVDAGDEEATVAGIALTNAGDGEKLIIQTSGYIITGATMTAAEVYVAGATAGAVNPASDITTNWRASLCYVSKTTTEALIVLGTTTGTR